MKLKRYSQKYLSKIKRRKCSSTEGNFALKTTAKNNKILVKIIEISSKL
jgi:hypothetical protein